MSVKSKLSTTNILLVALLLLVGFGVYNFTGGKQSTAEQQAGTPSPGQSVVCQTSPGFSQTLRIGSQNADTGASLTTTNSVYTNTGTGELNPGSTVTSPGSSYTVLSNITSYFKALTPVTTPCAVGDPQLAVKLKAVDTAISMSVINSDGLTLNAVTSSSTRQTLTASSPTTVTLRLQPSALNKHLSGPIGKFAIYMNASNSTAWDTSKMSASFKGQTCTPLGAPSPTVLTNTVVYGFTCSGDFTGIDTSYYPVSFTLSPSASYVAGNQTISLYVGGYDYFAQVSTNGANVAGSIQQGAVKDDGSAIQTLQGVSVYLQ